MIGTGISGQSDVDTLKVVRALARMSAAENDGDRRDMIY